MFLTVFLFLSLFMSLIWAVFLLIRILKLRAPHDRTQDAGGTNEEAAATAATCMFKDKSELKKLLPLSSANHWNLIQCVSGHRLWCRKTAPLYNLYGSSQRIKASSFNTFNYMKKYSDFGEWRPNIKRCSVVSETEVNQNLKWRQARVSNYFFQSGSLLSWLFEPLIEHDVTVARHFYSEDELSFIVEQVDDVLSTVFIIQPVIGLENDQSRITVLTTGNIHKLVEECSALADHYMMMRAPITQQVTSPPDVVPVNAGTNNNAAWPEEDNSEDCTSADVLENTPSLPHSSQEVLSDECSKHSDSYAQNDATESAIDNSDVSSVNRSLSKSVSFPEINRQEDGRSNISKAKSVNLEGATRIEYFGGSQRVEFLRSVSQDQQGLVDYRTLANTCAADLLREVHESTAIVSKPKDRTEALPPGWIFISKENDVVVLQKHIPGETQMQRWLGKALIKQHPDTVWKTVANPYLRYIHDEMLKDLTVVMDLGNGLKLLRLHYVGNNLLSRDAREFYILQTERIENQKRIVALCSVTNWPEPETKDLPRGKFGPTGWVIEPVVSKRQRTYSMVTYVSQIDLCSHDTPCIQQFEDEFITKQPNALAELRDFLMPLS